MIRELIEEHRAMRNVVDRLRQRLGRLDDAEEHFRSFCKAAKEHIDKERPLYQLVLEEVKSRLEKRG